MHKNESLPQGNVPGGVVLAVEGEGPEVWVHQEQLQGVPRVAAECRQVERGLTPLSLGVDVRSPRQKNLNATGSVPP